MNGMQIVVDFSANGHCSANVDVWVDTSQGWNAEAHAAEIRSELRTSIATVLRSCSNSKCLTAEAEAKQKEEKAKIERVKAAIANYQSACVEHVEAILQSGSLAISQVNVANEIALCSKAEAPILKDNMYGISDAEREQLVANARHVETLFKQIKTIQSALYKLNACITASPGTSWSGQGANLKMLVKWTNQDEFIKVSEGMVDAASTCGSLTEMPGLNELSDNLESAFDPLPNGIPLSDLMYYVNARLSAMAAMKPEAQKIAEEVAAQAAWNAAHCIKVCRCSANGQEVTIAWGSSCPYSGQYGCQEWDNAVDRWRDAYWEAVRKDCR
jgi:hypothetical protein